MDGITLSFTDARPVLAPGALEEPAENTSAQQ